MEAVLARGDRKVGKVILNAYKNGAIFDSWTEYFKIENWNNAFISAGAHKNDYTRQIPKEEVLCWDFIDIGINKEFFIRENNLAYQNKLEDINRQQKKELDIE